MAKTEERDTLGEPSELADLLGGVLLGQAGILDDRAVQPFKKLVDPDTFADLTGEWFPNAVHLPKEVRYAVYSAFYAGMLAERGIKPGDDPETARR